MNSWDITRKMGHRMRGIWSHINATEHLEVQPNFYWVRYFPVAAPGANAASYAKSSRWISHVLATISRRAHDNSRESGLLIIFLDFLEQESAREARMDEEASCEWEDRRRAREGEGERARKREKVREMRGHRRSLRRRPSWHEMNN